MDGVNEENRGSPNREFEKMEVLIVLRAIQRVDLVMQTKNEQTRRGVPGRKPMESTTV